MERTSRKPSRLSEPLQRHLNAYALAASAAGVGVLALGQPAEGEIIYTPSHVRIVVGDNGKYRHHLDLNHDGVIDFSLRMSVSLSSDTWLGILGASGNQAAGSQPRRGYDGLAYALRAGRQIGPDLRFGPYNYEVMAVRSPRGSCLGPWINVTGRYLGLRFTIKGRVHYGWARLNVTCSSKNDAVGSAGFSGLLTGYAYETIPNKPIITGKTKGPDVLTVDPGRLGHLAQGSAARIGK